MRTKFVARLLVAFLFAAIVVAVLLRCTQLIKSAWINCVFPTRKEADVYAVSGYRVQKGSDLSPTFGKESSHLIQRSVLLRYGDTDPLIIFGAYNHHDNITIILASYGYMM